MSEPPSDDVESVAALVGATQSQRKALDEQLVSPAGNLKKSQDAWDPQGILKDHMTKTGVGLQPEPAQATAAHVQPQMAPQPAMHPQQAQTYAQPAPPPVTYAAELQIVLQKLVEILDRLQVIESKVGNLESYDKKISDSVEKGMQNKIKQITIKLDDTKSR